MTTGLGALSDDRIDIALGKPQRFAQARRCADDFAACRPDARKQRLWRQAEMEADNVRPNILNGGAVRLAEGRMTCGKRQRGRR